MASRFAVFVVTTGLLLVTGAATAQERGRGTAPGGQSGGRQSGPGYLKRTTSNKPPDPNDPAGIWSPNGNAFWRRRPMPRLWRSRLQLRVSHPWTGGLR